MYSFATGRMPSAVSVASFPNLSSREANWSMLRTVSFCASIFLFIASAESRFCFTNTNVLSNVTKPLELLRRPGAGSSLHGVPDLVEAFEPTVGRGLVAKAAPDARLHVQGGLIGRQVLQRQPWGRAQEPAHRLAFVPAGAVDVYGDAVAPQTPIQMAEHFEEALTVTLFGADHAVAAEQRCYPAREVEACAVLARGGDTQALPALGPAEAQTWMHGEAGFVLEHHGLVGLKTAQFFLAPAGNAGHLHGGPADRHGWRASCGSRVGASRSGLGAP
jgi:hypothetical protein